MTSKSLHHTTKQAVKSAATGSKLPTLAAAAIGLLLLSPRAQGESLGDFALSFFLGNDSNTPGFDLDKARPQPVTSEYKVSILSSLPKEGRVTKFKESQLRKLASLNAILQLHERQSVYEYVVFKSTPLPFAFIGLNHRAALLISDTTLDLLSVEELQASVAHEIGHEYVWAEYLEAEKRNDERRLKELELICDGIAILTLHRAGLSPTSLLTAAQKIANYNRLTGPAANAGRYPSAYERKGFAQAILAWADSRRESAHKESESQVLNKATPHEVK
jgi:Peptidase family M48